MENLTQIYPIDSKVKRFFQVSQGVDSTKLKNIINKINEKGLSKKFVIKENKMIDVSNNREDVHKIKLENVMISKPTWYAKNSYKSHLVLHDDCAEMSDHVTGHHIQGVVLIEAARQMMLSVSENYILEEKQKGKFYFILNSINTAFYNFAFPLEITLLAEISNLEITKKGVLKAHLKVSFVQNKNIVTDIVIVFSAYEKEFFVEKEKSIAENAIKLSLEIEKEFSSIDQSNEQRKVC